MNDGMPGSPILALYVTGDAPQVFIGREANTSLPLYDHACADATPEKRDKILNFLRSHIRSNKLIFSPEFRDPSFRIGMTKILISQSVRKYEAAYFFSMDPNLDWDEIHSFNIMGPVGNDYFLFLSKFRNLKEAVLEPISLFTDSFFYFLQEQDFRTLHINCVADDCIFRDMEESNPMFRKLQGTLQMHCTALTTLTLRCACREHGTEMVSPMAKLVRQVPNLQKIRFATPVQANRQLAVQLEDLVRLGISLEFNVYRSHVEPVCTGLRHHFDLVKTVTVKHAGKREILDLVVFDYVETLELELISGGETKLIAVPSENIQTLRISASPFSLFGNHFYYYEPSENALSTAMNHMPRLKDVSIISCQISMSEMYTILQRIGNNLESLEISILNQEECPSQRLLDTCATMIRFNPNIRRFKIRDNLHENFVKALTWGTRTYDEYYQLYLSLVDARELLTLVAPMLEMWQLNNAIESLLPNAGVIDEIQNNLLHIHLSSPVTSDED